MSRSLAFSFPQPLAECYRPRRVADFVGVHRARKLMMQFVATPKQASWFFWGPSGLGKTTMALAVCEEIGGELHHIPSRNCDLETIEYVCKQCHYIPMAGGWHVVLADEADQMTPGAQMALLSKLDSTARPPNTIFIFTANQKLGLEHRFLSRCFPVEFERETLETELAAYLKKVYKAEGGRLPLAFDRIAKESRYNVRDALGKLELELMLGSDRSDLPSDKHKPETVAHTHACPKCTKTWPHEDDNCKLAYRSDCIECGGVLTIGSARAKKAWVTMRKNRKAELAAARASARKKPKRKAA